VLNVQAFMNNASNENHLPNSTSLKPRKSLLILPENLPDIGRICRLSLSRTMNIPSTAIRLFRNLGRGTETASARQEGLGAVYPDGGAGDVFRTVGGEEQDQFRHLRAGARLFAGQRDFAFGTFGPCLAFGRRVDPVVLHVDRADVIPAVESGFLDGAPGHPRCE
jgi:hypothetical protein